MSTFATASSRLSWGVLKKLQDDTTSEIPTIFSPLSIATALGMLAGGANVAKRLEFTQQLGLTDSDEPGTAFEQFASKLGSAGDENPLSVANAVFTDKSTELFPAYVDYLKRFSASTTQFPSLASAVDDINAWISRNTNELIKNMLSASALANSHIVLVNALAFKGIWKKQFNADKTDKQHAFQVNTDTQKHVEMMFLEKQDIETWQTEEFTAVRLPYAGSSEDYNTSMVAYLPYGDLTATELADKLSTDNTSPQFVPTKYDTFGFPKFKLEASLQLATLLGNLGYPISGNFEEMASGVNQVGRIIHQALINVDEKGTEAAAATAITMRRMRPLNPSSLVFDKPFLFNIIHDTTQAVLFTGLFTVA